jgi:hypothetical protein
MNNVQRGKGNNHGEATIGPTSQDYEEKIPAGMSWQTIQDSTGDPELTIIVLEIKYQKNENQKYFSYFSDAESSLGSKQNALIDGFTVIHMERRVR